ncbi:MAG: META domain-containing protein [Candidatus Marinimicrobia bacterium]|nr:META domain-containing protein [Candidatus Neomarinimicrobiota bacterium]
MMITACSTDDTTHNSSENELSGTWRVFAVKQDTVEELAPEDTLTITFTEEAVSGRAAGLCGNYFSGQYSAQGETIQFTNLASTEAACPASRYWTAYAIIERTDSYQFLSDGTLVLIDADSGDRMLLMEDD